MSEQGLFRSTDPVMSKGGRRRAVWDCSGRLGPVASLQGMPRDWFTQFFDTGSHVA